MTMGGMENSRSRNRKRGFTGRKLQINERVEVRSLEEGFLGSWHPGIVIRCGKLERSVRYENLLHDNGLNHLVEVVRVSNALDGNTSSLDVCKRGLIRPLPPLFDFEKKDLKFGLCVDVNHQEAWWEGVIFDHCDGMEERRIFFPDLGDEMKIGVHQLRITQDWDEVTETWERRGNWVFLELIEELERASYVAVSTKQIWYDIRERKDFGLIGEWTFNMKNLLKEMVMEVVSDYWTLTVKEVFSALDLPRDSLNETVESVKLMSNVGLNTTFPEKEIFEQKEPVLPVRKELPKFQNKISCNSAGEVVSGAICFEKNRENRSPTSLKSNWIPLKLSAIEFCPDAFKQYELARKKEKRAFWTDKARQHLAYLGWKIEWLASKSGAKHYRYISPDEQDQKKVYFSLIELCRVMQKESNMNSSLSQNDQSIMHPTVDCHLSHVLNPSEKSQDLDIFPPIEQPPIVAAVDEPVYCPQAMQKESNMNSLLSQNDQNIMHPTVDCHLSHVLNPSEKSQYLDICHPIEQPPIVAAVDEPVYCPQAMQKESNTNSLLSQNDQNIMHPTVDCHPSHVLLNPSEKRQHPDICPPIEQPPSVAVVDEPEYCPQAVMEYYSHAFVKHWSDKRKWICKAKKHLLAEGWIFDYPPPTNKKRGIIYISPQNRRFPTLHAACRFCIEVGVSKRTVSGMKPINASAINEENVDQVWSGDLLHRVSQLLRKEPELHNTDGVSVNGSTADRKRKRLRNSKASLPKCQSNGLPLRVLRSSKRVQNVSAPSLSHPKPLNVLSWLIDSNMVLPRCKVYYQEKCRHHALAVGKITRDGIKCNCCMKIYSLAGFEMHASGSSTRRPSASIFLEDGRSLLDYQIQIMQDHKTREAMEKPFSDLCHSENDYICSVCHYGGELILCDQCPSSFHKMCLGLEDIPDGDWFCPSCRCRICGQSKISGDEDGHFLTCIQCEHKYHIRCLKNRAVDKSRRYLENWFCGRDCEKIYVGLHKLLGEPVSVGGDNLTWTLMKFINSESCDLGSTKSDLLAESYSKLNVALSMMHECFEPLKEPFSSRDLMEDVIFSRWSELNRLNFQGFYTVLLERNDELVSVATVRVYGEKVAEVPLVGTRLQYRQRGMCHILMDELEKKLMKLGVERLVLPAVPSVLQAWTGSFGFTKMTNFERSQFLDYTFLDFQGTIMCQKLLMKIPSPDSVLSIEFQQKHDVFSGSCNAHFDKSSSVSEVYQGEIDKGGMLDQQMGDTNEGNSDHPGTDAIEPVTMVKQLSPEDQECHNGTSPQCSLVKPGDRYNGQCYTRRKVRMPL